MTNSGPISEREIRSNVMLQTINGSGEWSILK